MVMKVDEAILDGLVTRCKTPQDVASLGGSSRTTTPR